MKLLPISALVASAVMWGIALPAFKAAENVPPFSFALVRFVIAFLLVVPFYLLSIKQQRVQFVHLPKLLAAGILGVTLNIGLLFAGLKLTTATDASVITNLTPILSVFAAAVFLKEPLTKHHVFGSLIALLGALIIVGQPLLQTKLVGNANTVGNLLIVLSVISWVGFIIVSKDLFHYYSTLTIVTYQFLVGVITFTPLAYLEYIKNPNWAYTLTGTDVLAVGYYAIFGSILAYFFYEYGLSKVETATATITQHLIPIVSILIAVAFLGEKVTWLFVGGASLIFIGVLYSTHVPMFVNRQPPAQ